MLRTIPAILLAVGLVMLGACQPNENVVEVTRLVERENQVEVTRIIPETVIEEATRLVTEEVEVVLEVTKEPLGTAARPVQLLFPPKYDAELISQRSLPLVEALSESTGFQFRAGVLDSEQAVIDLMCAAPEETIGFLSPAGYVVAHEQCDIQVGSVAVDDSGLGAKMGMIVTRRDSDIDDLESLADKDWAVPDMASLSNYLYFQALLQESDIEVNEVIPVNGESVAMLAVFDEEVDLATAEFIPPILPFEETLWDREVDDPEPWRALGLSPERSPIGYVRVNGDPENGGYRVRDARSRVIDVAQDIFDETQIVALSTPIPNETVVYGPNFPLSLARQVEAELSNFVDSAACQTSLCSSDFYGWKGLTAAQDEMYEPIRFVQETLDLMVDELLEVEP
jgi:ABC-type phosphate/phosphonate transport system substrate-binding protein